MSKLSQFMGGGGGGYCGGLPVQIVSSNTTVDPNFSIGIDTSQGSVEVTLPARPLPGDRVFFFDAALTWVENPAIIHVNGNRVEQDTVALQSYQLRSRGGVQEILYVGGSIGWKDVSLYTTNVNPTWYGSYLAEEYPLFEASSLAGADREKILEVTSSGEHVVEDSGYYCIVMTGGGGGGGTNNYFGKKGGDSRLFIDGVSRLRVLGGEGGSANNNAPAEYRCGIAGFIEVVSLGDLNTFAIRILANERTLWNHDPSRLLGIYKGANTGRYGGGASHPSSIITHLNAGSKLRFTIGARGAGQIPSTDGYAGSADVYFLGESPWYTRS